MRLKRRLGKDSRRKKIGVEISTDKVSFPDKKQLSDRELEDLQAIQRGKRYLESPCAQHFTEAVWKDNKNKLLTCAPHHREWYKFIDQQQKLGYRRIGILSPYKHGKTPHVLSIILHSLAEDPNRRIVIISNDDDSAKNRVDELKQYIEHDTNFKRLFGHRVRPNKKRRWTSHSFFVERDSYGKDASIHSSGVLSTGIGSTVDQLVFDDICDHNNSVSSKSLREEVKERLRNVWLTRADYGAQVLYIATAWHLEDATHLLLNNPRWTWLIQRVSEDFSCLEQIEIEGGENRAGNSITGKFVEAARNGNVKEIPLWEPRWSKSELVDLQSEIGKRAFARGYRHEALDSSALTFPHFPNIISPWNPDYNGWRFMAGVDISSEKRPGKVIFTGAIGPDGKRTPVEIRTGNWDAPTFIKQIVESYNKYHHDIIMVENNGLQQMFIDWLKDDDPRLPICAFHTGSQKTDEIIGLPSLDVEFENGQWLFPKSFIRDHELGCNCAWCRFVSEFQSHPQYSTDDIVMAAWFFREAARLYADNAFFSVQEGGVYDIADSWQ